MEQHTRKGLAGAVVAALIFLPFNVAGTALVATMCDERGCTANPIDKLLADLEEAVGLAEDPTVQAQKQQQVNTRAVGYAQQYLYAVSLEHNGQRYTLMDALQKYFYCKAGPGEEGESWCQNVPPANKITGAVKRFEPTPSSPFGSTGVKFKAETEDGRLEASTGSTAGNSRFVFAVPMAGGENIHVSLELAKGSFVNGVFEQ